MKTTVRHAWKRLVAFICALAMAAAYLPALPAHAETNNGCATSVSADKSEMDIGDTAAFKAAIDVHAEESADEEYFHVTYVPEEGDAKGTLSNDSEWIKKGGKASCPDPSITNADKAKIHYEFDGWYTDENRENKYENGSITEATTLYAHYITLYRVSFETPGVQKEDVYIKAGESLKKEEAEAGLQYIGYTLDGFFRSHEGGSYSDEYTFDGSDGEKITKALTLYVRWKANSYQVRYFPKDEQDAGSTEIKGEMSPNPQDRACGDGKKLLKNVYSREGYTFKCWKDEEGTEYSDEDSKDLASEDGKTVKLYAQWTAHTYSVCFHRGTDVDEDTVTQEGFVFDKPEKLQKNVFAKDGYSGCVWTADKGSADKAGKGTAADFGESGYADGQLVLNLTSDPGGTVDLYPVWIDTEKPEITYKASVSNYNGTDPDNIDFAKKTVTYTVNIMENSGGSGVDPEEVYYAVEDPGTDPTGITEWTGPVRLSETELEEEEGGKITACQFDVTIKAKGAVFVKAQDKAVEAETVCRTVGEQTVQSVKGVKESPNVGYQEIHLIVIEDEAPVVNVSVVGDTAENLYTKKDHAFTYQVNDEGAGVSSGIQEITYSLTKGGEKVNNYSGCIIENKKKADHVPEKLSELENIISMEGSQDIVGEAHGRFPALNGEYTLTVTAVDFCGNEGSDSVTVKFDSTAPHIAAKIDSGIRIGSDGIWYYNADTMEDLVVEFVGEGDADTAPLSACYVELNGTRFENTEAMTDTTRRVLVTVPKKDILKLGDGIMSVTARAEDSAGNETDVIDDDKTGSEIADDNANGINRNSDRTSASFVVDTKAPAIILSMAGGNQYDDIWYYNKGNCDGGSIAIGDAGDAAPLKSCTVRIVSEKEPGSQQEYELKEVDGPGGASASIDLDKISKMEDGKITVTVTAEDMAGNVGDTITPASGKEDANIDEAGKEAGFVLDKEKPALAVAMSGGKEFADENQFYYRADNCGLTVEIGNSGDTTNLYDYSVLVRNVDNGNVISQELAAGAATNKSEDSERTRKVPSLSDDVQTGPAAIETVSVVFSAEEMQKLGDGHIEVTAVVRDYALNENKVFQDAEGNHGISGMKDREGDASKASVVLDLTNPVVTKISTTGTAKGQKENNIVNAAPYDEGSAGSFYYYNDKAVATTFTIEDVNLDAWTVSYDRDGSVVTQDRVKSTAVVTEGTDIQTQEMVAEYYDANKKTEASEGRYTAICVTGADKAGNPLILQTGYSYTGKGSNEVDPAAQSSTGSGNNQKGVITLVNGKVIDRTVPVAVLTYSTDATAYLYNGKNASNQDAETVAENYSIATAYVNKAFSAAVAIEDTYDDGTKAVALDFEKLTVRQYGKNNVTLTSSDAYRKDGSVGYTFSISTDNSHTTDGAYYYKVFGTDRAGNAMTVQEGMSDKVKTERISLDNVYETTGCADQYRAKLRFILDTINPTFTFALADPKGNETTDGNTAYYGSETKTLSGTFSVVDTYIDVDRIGAGYGMVTASDISGRKNAHYSGVSISWSEIDIENDLSNGGKGSTFTKSISKDKEGIYRYGISGVDKAGNPLVQSSGESEKTGYQATVQVENGKNGKFWTWHKVLDKTAPTGDLNIGSYYHVSMDSKGNNTLDTKSYAPYRKEKKAGISITSEDLSPVRITYNIDSTVSGKSQQHADADYKNSNKKSASVSGEQIFHVSDLLLMDRAGNQTGFYKKGKTEANKIYLDVTPPANYDVDRPQATIKASSKATASSPDGRDLFNKSIDLTVHVVDPHENVKSSGLKYVKYEVKADGKTVISKTHDGNTNKADLYKDVKLEHEFKETINIPKGGTYETNDIEITVTAMDNAGNEAETVTYKFGIDTVGPEIVVTYNNNSAQNGFYFKENRIATVEVTERNLDDDKIKIETQVGKAAFRNVRHSGNGNSDQWQKTLSYTADGNYTLNISGTDALGNPAKVSYANQVAPQKFTIDKTAPGVTVTYDNNDVQNGKYYKASRTATISISDVNFAGQNDIRVESRGGGSAPATVTFSGNTATIHFAEDGIYVFNGTVTDQAGNPTTIPVQTEFVVDTKVPVLTFEEGKPFKVVKASASELAQGKSDHPEDRQFFTTDDFAPLVTVTDTNISTADQDAVFQITGTKEGNTFTREIRVHTDDNTKFDMSMASTLFRVVEEVDDVYNVLAYAVDLAGNKSEEVTFVFSINRFGSNYVSATEETRAYIRDVYYHNTTQDLEIHEYNTNAIRKDTQAVEVMKDGNTANVKKLVPGEDYDFEEDRAAGSREGGRIYKYTIRKEVFEEEGDYSFTISSVDEAGHENTTSRIHRDTDETTGEKKLSVSSFPIDFVIDKTPPTNQMAGVKSDRKQAFKEGSIVVDVYPEDAQTGIQKVEIRRWETDTLGFQEPDGSPISSITYACFDDEDDPIPASHTDTNGTELSFADLADYTDTATDKIKIDYEITDSQNWQWIEVITTDLAGNDSVDIRAGSSDSAQIIENRKGFLVTTNTFTQVINNMAARVGAASAIILLLLILILWKRKKDKEKEGNAA